MTLARSGLKSDIVTDLGGITGALRFLRLRQRGIDVLNRAAEELEAGDDGLASLAAAIAIIHRLLDMFPERRVR